MVVTIKRYGGYKDGRLARFASNVKKGMKPTLKQIGTNVRDNAKNIVAVKTGRLQRSLRLSKLTKDSVFVGTTVKYGEVVEFGSISNTNYPMQPYLRPAIAITSKIMGKNINATLIKAWSGA